MQEKQAVCYEMEFLITKFRKVLTKIDEDFSGYQPRQVPT